MVRVRRPPVPVMKSHHPLMSNSDRRIEDLHKRISTNVYHYLQTSGCQMHYYRSNRLMW